MKQQYQVRKVENGWVITEDPPDERLWVAKDIDECQEILRILTRNRADDDLCPEDVLIKNR